MNRRALVVAGSIALLTTSCQSSGRTKEIGFSRRVDSPRDETLDCGDARDGDGHSYSYRVFPVYPRRAFEAARSGFVEMTFDVDESGRPVDIEITRASLGHEFDDAALTAFRKWRFCPNEAGKKDLFIRLEFAPASKRVLPPDLRIRGS